jgi:predicted GNAT family acetyltransferase
MSAPETGAPTIEVVDQPERERYAISLDGELAGFTAYVLRSGLIAFVHTEVDERFQGRGLADRLIREALDDARSRELTVLPFCPFVQGFIERHPEYVDLVPEPYRKRFGL